MDDVSRVRLMNDHGGGLPLWSDDIDDDLEDALSDALRSDLMAFADRWEAAIPPEVFDDRWDGVPIMRSLVSARYAVGRWLHPARAQAAAEEHEAMRRTGAALAQRVQNELGPRYAVTYVHG